MDDYLQTVAGGEDDGISVHSGFPNPAAYKRRSGQSRTLDLNSLLIRHSLSTYLFRIVGHQTEQGIFDGDIAIIDRVLPPKATDLVIFWENDSFRITYGRTLPKSLEPWGVITSIIHQYDR